MSTTYALLVTLCLCCALGALATQAPALTPIIAPFAGDRAGALSFTFDDGSQKQVDVAVPMLNAAGIKATFFVISMITRDKKSDPMLKGSDPGGHGAVSWEEWRAVAAMGHEIGNHSAHHVGLPRVTDPDVFDVEINGSRKLMTEKMGAAPLTFCYAGNGWTPAIREMVLRHHIADRINCVGYGGKDFTLERANAVVDKAIAEKSWLVPMIHGIDEAYAPLDHDILQGHLNYVVAKRDVLWVDTFANVARYRQEREKAVLTVHEHGTRWLTFPLTCPLDPAIYQMPLTVVLPLGEAKITRVRATRNEGQKLPATIAPGKLLVDVVPGAGEITVRWK
ncbi:MAG TPA: polysaccharide deacetylase family protein [Armatimonadota bacterium]|jgi:peptidoglycan/xylan/chitin deacetylase (PgdA/CDA1 family)